MAAEEDFSQARPAQTSIPIGDFPDGDELWRLRSIGRVRADGNDHRVELFLQRQSIPAQDQIGGLKRIADDGWLIRLGDSWARAIRRVEMPVGILPLTRVGSTWRRGELVSCTETLAQTERFNLSDVQGPGHLLMPSACGSFFAEHYFLPGSSYLCPVVRTEGRIVERFGVRRCIVLFPCSVIFADLFAPTSRVARLLLRFPEPGHPWERSFWFSGAHSHAPRTWFDAETKRLRLCLAKRVDNAARQHVALWFHDSFARVEAKRIHTFLSSQSAKRRHTDGSIEDKGAGLQVRLPFEDGRKMRVAGLLRKAGHFEAGRGWVIGEVLLVHQILWCQLSLPGVEVLEYERENPGAAATGDDGGDERSSAAKGMESAPEQGEDHEVDGQEGARAGQRALEWEVAAPANLFSGLVMRKVVSVDAEERKLARDRPAPEDDGRLSVGIGDYRKDSVPPLEILQTDRAAALLEEFADDPGFDFFARAVWHLAKFGWEVEQAMEEGWTMTDGRLRRARLFSHMARRIFVARLSRPEREAYLIEFEHVRVEARWTAQTATLVAHPQPVIATSLESLLEFVVAAGPHGPSLAAPPADLGANWSLRLVRHRYSPVRSGKDVRLVHAENLSLALDPQNQKYRTR